jgi:hypothetical protein
MIINSQETHYNLKLLLLMSMYGCVAWIEKCKIYYVMLMGMRILCYWIETQKGNCWIKDMFQPLLGNIRRKIDYMYRFDETYTSCE